MLVVFALMAAGMTIWLAASPLAHAWVMKRLMASRRAPSQMQSAMARAHGLKGNAAGINGFSVTSFDSPGAGSSPLQGTIALALNASGDITGAYLDSAQVAHGYIRTASGTFIPFSAPDAGTAAGPASGGTGLGVQGTIPVAINAGGSVIGTYIDSNSCYHGFVNQHVGSQYQLIEFDAVSYVSTDNCRISPYHAAMLGTRPIAINDAGVITGTYIDSNMNYRGFVRSALGQITTLDAPGAGSFSENGGFSASGTIPLAIDSSGNIAGTYVDNPGTHHGFYYSQGSFTTFDAPDAQGDGNPSSYSGTIPLGINDSGSIVGTYTDASLTRHGFIRDAAGNFTSFDIPGAGSGPGRGSSDRSGMLLSFLGTAGFKIDASGKIAGLYLDSNGAFHGFLRSAEGAITTLDLADAGSSILEGTAAFSLNSAGQIAGTYADASYVVHGFVISPITKPTVTVAPDSSSITSVESDSIAVTVSRTANGPTPTGSVTLTSGTYSSTAAALKDGTATITIPAGSLAVGSNTVTATYTPDSNSSAGFYSAAGTASITVSLATPTVTVVPAALSITTAQSDAVQITVSGDTDNPIPTGSVVLAGGGYTSASKTLSGGAVTITIPAATLAVGSDTLTASYTPDATSSQIYNSGTGWTTIRVVGANPSNPVPTITGITPAFTTAGGAAFTLTITGTGFLSTSTINWGATALTPASQSDTQLTLQIPASDIVSAGTTSITVVNPAPGGGTSNSFVFEVDSTASGSGPTITTVTATVAPGAAASYPVTVPSSASNISVKCLNLPVGASCSYSAGTGITITTSPSTPAGTYQITVVFTETLPGSASAWIFLPLLLLPLVTLRRKLALQRIVWLGLYAAVGLAACLSIGACGGGGSGGDTTPQTHTATSSAGVTLKVQ